MALLEVSRLSVSFRTADGVVPAVDDIGFSLQPGQTLALVGESGSGKSQTAMALLGLLPGNAQVSGSILWDGEDLLQMTAAQRRAHCGAEFGMVFQDPMTSLNPYRRIGEQMIEALQWHQGAGRALALAEAARLLDAVRITDAAQRLRQYPHELSGGMRQRVCMAMALMCKPRLLIADEPTTALDATVQAQLLRLLGQLRQDFGLAILLITHDLGIVRDVCEQVLVMYAGRLMEYGAAAELLQRPRHPYTEALLRSRPRLDDVPGMRLPDIPGQPPDALERPTGCVFAPRCQYAVDACTAIRPQVRASASRRSACHRLSG